MLVVVPTTTTKPLPCPFCGDVNVSIDTTDEVFRYVTCGFCGAHGPCCGSEDEDAEHGHDYAAAAERDAIAAWNDARRDAKRYRRSRKASGE